MALTPISTPGLASLLLQPAMQAQSQLAKASVEISTGQYADLGQQLGARSGYEISLRNATSLLQTMTASNGVITTALSISQSALGAVQSDGQNVLQSLTQWQNTSNTSVSLKLLAQNGLASLVSTANTASGGQYLFGGINSGVPPMTDYYSDPPSSAKTAIDQAFQATFGMAPSDPAASTISASDMQSFLSGPFASLFQGASWTTDWSSASSENSKAEIAPGHTVETSSNINNSGFQNMAQAYAMLDEFGDSQLSNAAKQVVVNTAVPLLTSGMSGITHMSASIGGTQQQVTNANSAISSQQTLVQTQLGNLDNVDPDEVAARIMALQTQLQTAYELTAQLHSMNLAQYL